MSITSSEYAVVVSKEAFLSSQELILPLVFNIYLDACSLVSC